MKILFMADLDPTPSSGASGTEVATVDALRSLGHEVTTVWRKDLGQWIQHGNLHYLAELPYRYRRALRARMRIHDFDVVHVNQPHGFLAARFLKQSGSRAVFVHRSHGFEPHVKEVAKRWVEPSARGLVMPVARTLMRHAIERNYRGILRWADGHIVSASSCWRYIVRRYGAPESKVAVIPQAVPNLYLETPVMPMTPDRIRRVLYVGQFTPIKAPNLVADTFGRLAKSHADLKLTWVCAAGDHLRARALLPDAVRGRVQLHDWLPQSELMSLYDSHGLFLFPSYFEGFGKAFLEAMSRGMCVVATDTGGAADVITDRRNGCLVELGSGDALVGASEEVISDPGLAGRLSRASSAEARSFTWNRTARETASFYQKLLDHRR